MTTVRQRRVKQLEQVLNPAPPPLPESMKAEVRKAIEYHARHPDLTFEQAVLASILEEI